MSKRVLGLFKGLEQGLDLVQVSGFSEEMIEALLGHLFDNGFINQDHSLSAKGFKFLDDLNYQESIIQEKRALRKQQVKTAILLVDQCYDHLLQVNNQDTVLSYNVEVFQKLGFERIYVVSNDFSIAPSSAYELVAFDDHLPLVQHLVAWLETTELKSFILVNGCRLFESKLIAQFNQRLEAHVVGFNRENSNILEIVKADASCFKGASQAETLRDLIESSITEETKKLKLSPKSIRGVKAKNVKQRHRKLLKRESKYHQAQAGDLISLLVSDEKIDKSERLGGLTNRNYYFSVDNQHVVARIPGDFTQDFINRRFEDENSTLMSLLGINSSHIYFNRDDGSKVAGYIPNALTYSPKLLEDKVYLQKAAQLLKKLHQSKLMFINDFEWQDELAAYEKIVSDQKVEFPKDYEATKARVLAQYRQLENKQRVACHCDALCENFVLDSKANRLYLVDWEYSGNNYPAWDLASLIVESQMNDTQKQIFLEAYADIEVNDVNIFMMIQDFLWSIWGLMKYAQKMDFYDYFEMRYQRAKQQLDNLERHVNESITN